MLFAVLEIANFSLFFRVKRKTQLSEFSVLTYIFLVGGNAKIEINRSLAIFEGKRVRKAWHNNEWWFVVEDIVFALTDSKDAKQYINKIRQRDEAMSQGWVQIVHALLVDTSGGKQNMNCTNTEGAFRIIQSIPSARAEPFKLWLAKVGYERVQEIENPELAQDRVKQYYELKGYPKEWIDLTTLK